MNIDVVFSYAELAQRDIEDEVVVVIDVIRATTTMVQAFEAGCKRIIPVATPEEALAILGESPAGRAVLGGERGGVKIPGFDLGNSPHEYARGVVGGKTVILTTTNGTKTLLAVSSARHVLICAMLNARAVAHRLMELGENVVVACAGDMNRMCLEDAVCAGIISRLMSEVAEVDKKGDSAKAAEVLADRFGTNVLQMLRETHAGRQIQQIGLGADLEFCARMDTSRLVPRFEAGKIVSSPSSSSPR